MRTAPALSLPEWTVLALLAEAPRHGFAVAQLTAPDGELGRIWRIPRQIVYRALARLVETGLIESHAVEPGRGPRRTIYAVTPAGRTAAAHWLEAPVDHFREVRPQLLIKLALLDRAGIDRARLLRRQRVVFTPLAAAIDAESPQPGLDATLLAWQRSMATAALAFLDEISH